MSTETLTVPSLREVLLDAIEDAYWYRKGEVEDCFRCRQSPAGVCADLDHQNSLAMALEYEEARKTLQQSPDDPEVLAVFAGLGGAS